MDAKTISIWLTIVSAIATGYARLASLEEAKINQERAITDVRGYLTAAEQRVSALERDRAMWERLHQLELRLGAIEEQQKERRR
jgi:hypothetical protein